MKKPSENLDFQEASDRLLRLASQDYFEKYDDYWYDHHEWMKKILDLLDEYHDHCQNQVENEEE